MTDKLLQEFKETYYGGFHDFNDIDVQYEVIKEFITDAVEEAEQVGYERGRDEDLIIEGYGMPRGGGTYGLTFEYVLSGKACTLAFSPAYITHIRVKSLGDRVVGGKYPTSQEELFFGREATNAWGCNQTVESIVVTKHACLNLKPCPVHDLPEAARSSRPTV